MSVFSLRREVDSVNALARLQQELERVFQNPFGWELGLSGRGVQPPVNIFRDGAEVVVRMQVPGFAPEQLSVESRGQTLIIGGKREESAPAEGGWHRRERAAASFSRSVELPREFDPAQAVATSQRGVLTVRVKARAESVARQIAVNSN